MTPEVSYTPPPVPGEFEKSLQTAALQAKIAETVKSRLDLQRNALFEMVRLGIDTVHVAGGVAWPHHTAGDVDLFPVTEPFEGKLYNSVLKRSKNAYNLDSVQFITRYEPMPLRDLIKDFDFSHCQAGATVRVNPDSTITVLDAAFTEDWKDSHDLHDTRPVGRISANSILRVNKVAQKFGWGPQKINEIMLQTMRVWFEQTGNLESLKSLPEDISDTY